jgi:hypothetical protein
MFSGNKKHDDYYIIPIGSSHADECASISSSSTSGRHRRTSNSIRNDGSALYRSFFFSMAENAESPARIYPDLKKLQNGGSNDEPPKIPSQKEKQGPPPEYVEPNAPPEGTVNERPAVIGTDDMSVEGMNTIQKKDPKDDAVTGQYNNNKHWFYRFSKRKIYVLNSIAVFLHFILLVSIGISTQGKSAKFWRLKQDRTYASPASRAGTKPFVQVCQCHHSMQQKYKHTDVLCTVT